jgi:hypothetical protein
MKKIIAGAVYNTETAKELGKWRNGYRGSDFQRCEETLYRTKSGKYFLDGEGGPMSKYCVNRGNSTSGGEEILPLTPQEAREWAEEKLNADEYIALFGEVEEASDGREALNLTVPADIKAKLIKMREDTGRSISQIIVDLVSSL